MPAQLFASSGEASTLHRLELILRVVFVFFTCGGLIPVALAASTSGATTVLIPVALTLIGTFLVLIRVRPTVSLALMTTALALAVVLPGGTAVSAPRILIGIVSFALLVHYSRGTVIRAELVIAPVYVALHAVIPPHTDWLPALDDAVLAVSLTMSGAVFIDVLAANITRLDRVRQERVDAELSDAFASASHRVHSAAQHLLHDEIIGTLSAVADHRGAEEQPLRDACARAAHLLSSEAKPAQQTSTSLSALVAAVSRETAVSVTPGRTDESVIIDRAQYAALDRALREALRNVHRHSGCAAAEVSWWVDQSGTHLTVTDQGVGVPRSTARWGLRHSIVEPIGAIGGSCELRPNPGGGAILSLWWPPHESRVQESNRARIHQATRRATAHDDGLALSVTLPVLAGNTWLAVRYSWEDPQRHQQLILIVVICAVAVAAVRHVNGRPPTRRFLIALALTMGALVWVGLRLAGPGALMSYESWVVGLSSVPLTLAAFFVSITWAAVLAIPITSVVLLHAHLEDLSWGESGGAVNAAVLTVLLGHVFGSYLRWSQSLTEQEEARVARTATEAHLRLVNSGAGSLLAFARERATPWLRSIADGQLDPTHAAVQAEAKEMATEMRDELHLPGLIDAPLRQRIAAARRSGTEVVLVPPGDHPRDLGPYLRLLDRVLDLCPGPERILLTLPSGSRAGGEVAVIPLIPADRLDEVLRCLEGSPHTVEHDLFSTRITMMSRAFT